MLRRQVLKKQNDVYYKGMSAEVSLMIVQNDNHVAVRFHSNSMTMEQFQEYMTQTPLAERLVVGGDNQDHMLIDALWQSRGLQIHWAETDEDGFEVFDYDDLYDKKGPEPCNAYVLCNLPRTSVPSHEKCTICLEGYEDSEKAVELPCTHRFHKTCATSWLAHAGTCPICRQRPDALETCAVCKKGADPAPTVVDSHASMASVFPEPSEPSRYSLYTLVSSFASACFGRPFGHYLIRLYLFLFLHRLARYLSE